MRNHIAKAAITAPIVAVVGTGAVLSYGWKYTAGALAVLVVTILAGLAVRAIRRGNNQADQIFDDETGGTGPNKGLGPKDLRIPHDPTDTSPTTDRT